MDFTSFDFFENNVFYLKEKDKDSLVQSIKNKLADNKKINFAYLFGSFIEQDYFRDIDVAVFLYSDFLPELNFIFEEDLAKSLMCELPKNFPVDIRILNSSSISFQYNAIRGKLLVDKDPEIRYELISYVLSRHFDLKPILRHHTRELFDLEN